MYCKTLVIIGPGANRGPYHYKLGNIHLNTTNTPCLEPYHQILEKYIYTTIIQYFYIFIFTRPLTSFSPTPYLRHLSPEPEPSLAISVPVSPPPVISPPQNPPFPRANPPSLSHSKPPTLLTPNSSPLLPWAIPHPSEAISLGWPSPQGLSLPQPSGQTPAPSLRMDRPNQSC